MIKTKNPIFSLRFGNITGESNIFQRIFRHRTWFRLQPENDEYFEIWMETTTLISVIWLFGKFWSCWIENNYFNFSTVHFDLCREFSRFPVIVCSVDLSRQTTNANRYNTILYYSIYTGSLKISSHHFGVDSAWPHVHNWSSCFLPCELHQIQGPSGVDWEPRILAKVPDKRAEDMG